MRKPIQWGILGTGKIATKVAEDMRLVPDAKLVAVGSRSKANADAFGDRFGVRRRHASYAALVNDPEVDAVYIATPHSCHRENALLALEAGKPVLCEKPFTINAAQAEEVIQCARDKSLLLMEAMWTRFLPAMVKLRQMLDDGVIGDVRMLSANFGFRAETEGTGRLFSGALGGGALLDIGVYPLSLASMVFGPPSRVTGMARLGRTGVDKQSAMILGYPVGQLAVLYSTIEVSSFHEAEILGVAGRIKIHGSWCRATSMTLMRENLKNDFFELPFEGNGYQFEIIEFMNCLREGRLESDVMPLDETLSIVQTMDCLREQWGLEYPMEKEAAQQPVASASAAAVPVQ